MRSAELRSSFVLNCWIKINERAFFQRVTVVAHVYFQSFIFNFPRYFIVVGNRSAVPPPPSLFSSSIKADLFIPRWLRLTADCQRRRLMLFNSFLIFTVVLLKVCFPPIPSCGLAPGRTPLQAGRSRLHVCFPFGNVGGGGSYRRPLVRTGKGEQIFYDSPL